MRGSDNLLHALAARECSAAPPCASVHAARRFYERIVPSHTAQALDNPDCFVGKFTDDGKHLLCFSRGLQDVLVYRYHGLAASTRGDAVEAGALPAHARQFLSFFTHLHSTTLAAGQHTLCRDFCLFFRGGEYAVLASSSPVGAAAVPPPAAAAAAPLLQSITFLVLRVADGHVCDRRDFRDDFMSLSQNACASAFDNLLTVLSLRHQTVHVYTVGPDGSLQDVLSAGAHCDPGDEDVLRTAGALAEPGARAPCVIAGLKQRLLSFLFLTAQRLAAAAQAAGEPPVLHPVQLFFRHFCNYHDLLLSRARLLNSCQLLLQFSFPDAMHAFDLLQQPAFVGVYDFVATRFVAFVSCSSDDFTELLERSPEQFCPLANDCIWTRCAYNQVLQSFRRHQMQGGSRHARRVGGGASAVLAPHCVSLSPYLDHRLFQFDDKMVSAGERPRPCVDYPIKFSSTMARHNAVRFRLTTGPQTLAEGRSKWVASFVFHPTQPFALSVLQSFMHPQQINAHFRWQ